MTNHHQSRPSTTPSTRRSSRRVSNATGSTAQATPARNPPRPALPRPAPPTQNPPTQPPPTQPPPTQNPPTQPPPTQPPPTQPPPTQLPPPQPTTAPRPTSTSAAAAPTRSATRSATRSTTSTAPRRICLFCAEDPRGQAMHAMRPCDWQDGTYPLECTNCSDHRAANPANNDIGTGCGHSCEVPPKPFLHRRYSRLHPIRYDNGNNNNDNNNDPSAPLDNLACATCHSDPRNRLSCDVDPILGYRCSTCKSGAECRLLDGRLMAIKPNVRQGIPKWFRHACDACTVLSHQRSSSILHCCSWLADRTTCSDACGRCRSLNLACISSGIMVRLPRAVSRPLDWSLRSFLSLGWSELRASTSWRKICTHCHRDSAHCRVSTAYPHSACGRCTALGLDCVSDDGITYPIFDLSKVGFGDYLPFTQCRRCAAQGRNCDRQRPCDSCTAAGEAHLCDDIHDRSTEEAKKRGNNCIYGRLNPAPGALYYLAHGYGARGVDDVKDGSRIEHWVGPFFDAWAAPSTAYRGKSHTRAVERDRNMRKPGGVPPHAVPGTLMAEAASGQLTGDHVASLIRHAWPDAELMNAMPDWESDQRMAREDKMAYITSQDDDPAEATAQPPTAQPPPAATTRAAAFDAPTHHIERIMIPLPVEDAPTAVISQFNARPRRPTRPQQPTQSAPIPAINPADQSLRAEFGGPTNQGFVPPADFDTQLQNLVDLHFPADETQDDFGFEDDFGFDFEIEPITPIGPTNADFAPSQQRRSSSSSSSSAHPRVLPYDPFSPAPRFGPDADTMPGYAMMIQPADEDDDMFIGDINTVDLLSPSRTRFIIEAEELAAQDEMDWLLQDSAADNADTDDSTAQPTSCGVNPFQALPLQVEQQQQQQQQQQQENNDEGMQGRWTHLNPLHELTRAMLGERPSTGDIIGSRRPIIIEGGDSYLAVTCPIQDMLRSLPEPGPATSSSSDDDIVVGDAPPQCTQGELALDSTQDSTAAYMACGAVVRPSQRCASSHHDDHVDEAGCRSHQHNPTYVCDGCAQTSTNALVDARHAPWTAAEILQMRSQLCSACSASAGVVPDAMRGLCHRVRGLPSGVVSRVFGRYATAASPSVAGDSSVVFVGEARPMTGCACGSKMFATRQCHFHRIDHAEAVLSQVAAVREWQIQTLQQGKCIGCQGEREPGGGAMQAWFCLACGSWVVNQPGSSGLVAGWQSWFETEPASLTTVMELDEDEDVEMTGT